MRARPGDLRQIQTLSARQSDGPGARQRYDRHLPWPVPPGQGRAPRVPLARQPRCPRRLRGQPQESSGRRGRDIISAFAIFQQDRNGGVDLDAFGAFGDQNLADGAFVNGLELHRGLVGFDLGQQVAGGDGVALFDQPFGKRAFLHGGRKGGHQNFGGHVFMSSYFENE